VLFFEQNGQRVFKQSADRMIVTNQATPQTQQLAQSLLSCEATLNEFSENKEQAVFSVCEKLRVPLSTLVGIQGFRSLLSRALTLAKAQVPSLAAVQVKVDGSLSRWDSVASQQHLNEAGVCAEVLLAQLLELLITFIGKTLTLGILMDIWPNCGGLCNKMENIS
jgi:hypothetical protein